MAFLCRSSRLACLALADPPPSGDGACQSVSLRNSLRPARGCTIGDGKGGEPKGEREEGVDAGVAAGSVAGLALLELRTQEDETAGGCGPAGAGRVSPAASLPSCPRRGAQEGPQGHSQGEPAGGRGPERQAWETPPPRSAQKSLSRPAPFPTRHCTPPPLLLSRLLLCMSVGSCLIRRLSPLLLYCLLWQAAALRGSRQESLPTLFGDAARDLSLLHALHVLTPAPPSTQ